MLNFTNDPLPLTAAGSCLRISGEAVISAIPPIVCDSLAAMPPIEALRRVMERLGIPAKGIIHVGAHDGQEIDGYQYIGFSQMVWVEANPAVYKRLLRNIGKTEGCVCVNVAIAHQRGTAELRVMNNDECSSLLPLGKHAELYPEVREESRIMVDVFTIDDVVEMTHRNPEYFNVLHLDIQGAELYALQGAAKTLKHIDVVSCELNFAEMYEGCPMASDIDAFLSDFDRVRTDTADHPEWGDGLYVRRPRRVHMDDGSFNVGRRV